MIDRGEFVGHAEDEYLLLQVGGIPNVEVKNTLNLTPTVGDEIVYGYLGSDTNDLVALAVIEEFTVVKSAGDYYVYSKKDNGIVSEIHLKNSGAIEIKNDNGIFELKSNGAIDMNNGNLTVDV